MLVIGDTEDGMTFRMYYFIDEHIVGAFGGLLSKIHYIMKVIHNVGMTIIRLRGLILCVTEGFLSL